ncbi:MAG TPA: Hsp20/alpha crystallin family protein [Syntrophales bacterium]|jgi:HSP20 family protein|nr:Hsp20/alpha crystallin family protein [Syntrophales bacterium]HON23609.1 Hsp20/alpha crystallin family protein [Syntrophales bacterium]HOU78334.1 Hsp20/alpha crystallin family protein [Syntrophales bacterium]HPC31540.1 Hsp20/alpha crystallin family protein [Syntrophales bacterium]HQG34757.1 Hsp20/alpha crystallin family protein [Syntrophales bacterium]
MIGRDFLPSLWNSSAAPSRPADDNPFFSIQREMNRLFDDFFRGADLMPARERLNRFVPSLDVRENDKEVTIKAELPGMDEKDVELLVTENSLTLKGEKKEEKEDKGKDYYHMERSYGSFQRVIPLPEGIDINKVEAKFKKGVLSINLPKLESARTKGKKIEIKSA